MSPPNRRDAGQGSAPAASLIEISRVLEETARIVRRHADIQAECVLAPLPAGAPLDITAPLIRAILRIRRLRAEFLPQAAGDPAWTMILELYAGQLEGRPMNQTRLAVAAEVAHTTGLRIVRALVESGVLLECSEPVRNRGRSLRLSDAAADKVRTYLTVAVATVPYLA